MKCDLKPKATTNADTIRSATIPSSIATYMYSAVALVIAKTNMTLATPAVVVSIPGTTGKDTWCSSSRKVVSQVEGGRHSKIFIK
jgi:hypothetical protein